ncbi:hypothetical protein ACOMHN_021808 [Nucella lapillus]
MLAVFRLWYRRKLRDSFLVTSNFSEIVTLTMELKGVFFLCVCTCAVTTSCAVSISGWSAQNGVLQTVLISLQEYSRTNNSPGPHTGGDALPPSAHHHKGAAGIRSPTRRRHRRDVGTLGLMMANSRFKSRYNSSSTSSPSRIQSRRRRPRCRRMCSRRHRHDYSRS